MPMYNGKYDSLVCGSYRAIKLLEHPVKVIEIVGKEGQVSFAAMQFGCMPGKGTTDANFHHATNTRENAKQRRRRRCTMLLWI